MPIQLAADLEARIRQKVDGGFFLDHDQVIREALRLLDEQDQTLAPLRAQLQSGRDQLARGEGVLFTPDWSTDRVRVARERAAAGDSPHPDVCP